MFPLLSVAILLSRFAPIEMHEMHELHELHELHIGVVQFREIIFFLSLPLLAKGSIQVDSAVCDLPPCWCNSRNSCNSLPSYCQ